MNKINIFYEHIMEAQTQNNDNIPLEKLLEKVKSMGIVGLECDLWRLADMKNTKALFDSCGLSVSSVYNMFDFGHEEHNTCEQKYRKHLETAAYFGADKVLAVAGFINADDNADLIRGKMCEELDRMCEAAKEYGITVTLEDFDDINAPFCTTDGLAYFMENVKGLGFTFDTGNFAYCMEDAGTAYSRLKKYVSHVHLKDRSYDEKRSDKNGTNGKAQLSGKIMYPCEVGSGFIGIEGLMAQLLKDGYSGSFSIEHFGASDQLEYMKRSAENVKKYLERK